MFLFYIQLSIFYASKEKNIIYNGQLYLSQIFDGIGTYIDKVRRQVIKT